MTVRDKSSHEQSDERYLAVGPVRSRDLRRRLEQLARMCEEGQQIVIMERNREGDFIEIPGTTGVQEVVVESAVKIGHDDTTMSVDLDDVVEEKESKSLSVGRRPIPPPAPPPPPPPLRQRPQEEASLVADPEPTQPTPLHTAEATPPVSATAARITVEPRDSYTGRESSNVFWVDSAGEHHKEETVPTFKVDGRSHDRLRVEVSVTLGSRSNFWTGITNDISGGGLFVSTYNVLPIGSRVQVSFSLPDGQPKIEGIAEVRWVREYREDNDAPPGMGFRFVSLSTPDETRIGRFVRKRETIYFDE